MYNPLTCKSTDIFLNETKIVDELATNDSFDNSVVKIDQQYKIFLLAIDYKTSDETKLESYKNIIDTKQNLQGSALKKHMIDQIYTGSIDTQGLFIHCPIDFHKGPFLNKDDEYNIIFGTDTEKNIKDNMNHNLFEPIKGTEITKGMLKYAEGIHWNNGLICYNKNNIVIRDQDNNYGQPGFLQVVNFYDNLSVEIMKRYIVPMLIRQINEKIINEKSHPKDIKHSITNMFQNTYYEKLHLLNQDNMVEEKLFEDKPLKETLNQIIEPYERQTHALEWKFISLNQRLSFAETKIIELEEIILDLSIKLSKFMDSNSNLDNV